MPFCCLRFRKRPYLGWFLIHSRRMEKILASLLGVAVGRAPKRPENFRKPPFLPRPIGEPRGDRGVSVLGWALRGRGRGKYHAAGRIRSPTWASLGRRVQFCCGAFDLRK